MSELPDNAQYCEKCHNSPIVRSAPHHLRAGSVLCRRYLIGKAIGEGGFGITYVALDTNLDLKVAIKEFFPKGFANRDHTVTNNVTLNYTEETAFFNNAKERFLQEAKSVAKFSDESAFVNVRDYFTANNTAYIVMEYVEGTTLAAYLKQRGNFPPDEIVKRMLPLIDALEVMHSAQIIHRDISPENIMVKPDGSFKLMDFGSARYYQGENKHTMSVLLKPGYAPIEQYSSDGRQGPWTDVYGLCAVIYKSLTGKTPVDAMLRCQRDTLQRPSELNPAISPALEAVLLRGLSVFEADRIQDMPTLKNALCDALYNDHVDHKDVTRLQNQSYGDRYNSDLAEQNAPKKNGSKSGVIAAVIAVLLISAAAIAAVLFLPDLFGKNNSKETSSATQIASFADTQAAAASVSAETEQTEQPVEETAYYAEKVILPDVVGNKYTEARETLSDLGINTEVAYEESDSVAEGYVIRQSIDPGKTLARGKTLLLYVSSGKPTESPAERITEAPRVDLPTVGDTEQAFPETPYLIKVFPNVDVYESPDANSAIVMTLTEENVYTIVEETYDGYGRWGRLKSGAGWICVSDVLEAGGYIVEN